jgi:DNA-binding NtrC family response regulator
LLVVGTLDGWSDVSVGDPAPICTGTDLAKLDLIGASVAFRAVTALIARLARCDVTVLLRGETGTGKELAARAIHYLGARRDLPFVPVNCGAIPDMLVESELFGHTRGAFTDARDAQVGLVSQAGGGTLFLDEVDSLSVKAQIALLRFLQDGTFRPLGAKTFAQSKARVIAATNADIDHLVERGLFRRDLFFRLAIIPVCMPPLREREGDIRLLAENFLRMLVERHGGGPRRIDAASLRRLERYDWPGNVREMANVIQRAFLLSPGERLVLPADALGAPEEEHAGSAGTLACVSYQAARAKALSEFERRFLSQALAQSAGNVSLAARLVGKERRSFGRLLKKHGIDRTQFAPTSTPSR